MQQTCTIFFRNARGRKPTITPQKPWHPYLWVFPPHSPDTSWWQGFTYELAIVVAVLSYSMISGKTSLLNDTGISGDSERATEAAWCSCIGLVNEFTSKIVMASGLRFRMDLSLERRARRRVSSKGRIIYPVEDISTSIVIDVDWIDVIGKSRLRWRFKDCGMRVSCSWKWTMTPCTDLPKRNWHWENCMENGMETKSLYCADINP